MGGWETFGIQDAFDAVINPVMVNPIPGSAPVGVANPDGLVTSVGVPENSVTDPDPPSIGKYYPASRTLLHGCYDFMALYQPLMLRTLDDIWRSTNIYQKFRHICSSQ